MVSDKCDAIGSAKVFSQLMLVTGLAPILAPMLGGVLVNLYGWQSIFIVLTLFSALSAFAVAFGLPESLPVDQPRQPLSGALRQYGRLLSDRVFVGHALLTGGIAIAGMFAYIAGSPFVFIKLYGIPAEHYGWLFGSNAAGFILVAQVNARLLGKLGPALLLARAVWVYVAAGLSLLGISLLHTTQLWPLLVPSLFRSAGQVGASSSSGRCWSRCSSASPAWAASSPMPPPAPCAGRAHEPAAPRRCSAACSSVLPQAPHPWSGCCTMAAPLRWRW